MQYISPTSAGNFYKITAARLIAVTLLLLILQIWLPQPASAQLAPGDPDIVEMTSTHTGTDSLCPGDMITYAIKIHAPFEDTERIELIDELPEYVEYVADSATNGAKFFTEPHRIEWAGPVSIGNPNHFEFQVRIQPDTLNGTVITNIAETTKITTGTSVSYRTYFDYTEYVTHCPALEPQPPSDPMDEPTECLAPSPDMVAWWPLDETDRQIASDIAERPNDGIHLGSPAPTSGMVAGGLSFDGIDDKIVVPYHWRHRLAMWGNFTISAWIRTNNATGNATGYQPIVDRRSLDFEKIPFGYNLFLQDGHLGFNISTNTSGSGERTSTGGIAATPDLADGEWHLITVTFERKSRRGGKLYVDGQVVHTFPTTPLGFGPRTEFDLVIGSHNLLSDSPVDFFTGTIDEVEISEEALSQEQIQTLYQTKHSGRCKSELIDGEIYGTIWHDINLDSTPQADEPRLADWTVLLKNEAGSIKYTKTDAEGNYRFKYLPNGEYIVGQVFQPGWSQKYPNRGLHSISMNDEYIVGSINFGNHQNGQESCHISRHVDLIYPYMAKFGIYMNNQSDKAYGYTFHPISIPSLTSDNSMTVNLFDRNQYLYTSLNLYSLDHFAHSMQNAYAEIDVSSPPLIWGSSGHYQFIALNEETSESFACSTQLWSSDSIGVEPLGNVLNRELRAGEALDLGFVVRNLSTEASMTAQLWAEGLFMEDGVDLEILRVHQVEPQLVELGPEEWTQVSVTVELSERIMNGVGDVSLFADINEDGEPDVATSIIVQSVGPDSDLMLQRGNEGELVWGKEGLLTIDVSNVGDTVADTFVTVVDILPEGITARPSYSGDGWTCDLSGRMICRYTALPIAAGESLPTLRIPVNVNSPTVQWRCATLHHGADKNLKNNQACTTFDIQVDPDSGIQIVIGNLDQSPISVMLGQIVDVPVTIRDIPADVLIGSTTIEVHYNAALLEPVTCETDPDGVIQSVLCNKDFAPDIVKMAVADVYGLDNEARLASMQFRAIGVEDSPTLLEAVIDNFVNTYADPIPHVAQNGSVEITNVVKGDVDCNNHFSAVDAMFILQHELGMRDTTDVCPLPPEMLYEDGGDVNNDGKIDAIDGLLILQCDIGSANSLCPAGTTFENLAGVGNLAQDESSTAQQKPVTLRIEDAENINIGDTFIVAVEAESEASIGAVTASIGYNADQFEYVDCQTMDSNGISSAGCNQIVNENGEHRIVFNAVIPDGKSGSLHLAEVTFTAIGTVVDMDKLSLQVHTFADLAGQPLGIAAIGNRAFIYLPMIIR